MAGFDDAVRRGRACHAEKRWEDAWRALSEAEADGSLEPDDLERLAVASALSGRDPHMIRALERAHDGWVARGEPLRAARAAFWAAMRLGAVGERARSSGWVDRAVELVGDRDCAEQGYLLVLTLFRGLRAGDWSAVVPPAEAALAIGGRFADADLVAFARHFLGQARIRQGQVDEGLRLLDRTMLAATQGELGPVVTGLLYCNVIACCQLVYAADRSREWTAALAAWCDAQPQLVPFSGQCLVHRSEVLALGGHWLRALEEARRAEQSARAKDYGTLGQAHYLRAEVHRLRGERAAAEEGFRAASQGGYEPQPGLALLRLAEGRAEAARASLARILDGTAEPLARARYLPAWVEVAVAAGDLDAARSAATELAALAARFPTDQLAALAATARGRVDLAAEDPRSAVTALRTAFATWQGLDAPYHAARARALLGAAYEALGDPDGAALEREAARTAFAALGAVPDLDALGGPAPAHGLTPREVEVLQLVARGDTNKEIARALGVSLKTVDRHVSNLFAKLGLSTRAAATTWAWEHGLRPRGHG